MNHQKIKKFKIKQLLIKMIQVLIMILEIINQISVKKSMEIKLKNKLNKYLMKNQNKYLKNNKMLLAIQYRNRKFKTMMIQMMTDLLLVQFIKCLKIIRYLNLVNFKFIQIPINKKMMKAQMMMAFLLKQLTKIFLWLLIVSQKIITSILKKKKKIKSDKKKKNLKK